MHSFGRSLLAAFVLSLAGAIVVAQSVTTAQIDVLDQDNNPIPDALVTLEYHGHVLQRYKGKTNKKGRFTYVNVYIGPYTIKIVKDGFGEAVIENFGISDKGQFDRPTQLQLKRKAALPLAADQPLTQAQIEGAAVAIQQAINAAVALVGEGKYDEAEAAYRKLIELIPNSAPAHYNLGFLFKRKNQLEQAEAEFRKAIECDPKQGEAYNALAVLLVERGQSPEALLTLEAGVAAGAPDARLNLSLGIMYMTGGRPDAARQAFLRSVELDPTAAEPHFHLASVAISSNNVAEGVAELDKYLALAPPDAPNVVTAKGLLAALRPGPKKK
jgi:Tfp pilus assembly protein PilF